MASILIDVENIIKPRRLSLLKSRIQPIPDTKYSLGIVLSIKQNEYQTLEGIPKGDKRVEYINSPQFVDSITGHAYLNYDKKRKVCEIMGVEGPNPNILKQVIENVLSSIPNDVILWIGILLNDPNLIVLIKDCISVGFHEPYICKISPLGTNFNNYVLCMLRENDIVNNNAENDIKYVLNQFISNHKNCCTINVRLSNNAVEYLSSVSKMGSTINENGVITQKELAGKLIVGNIDNDLIYNLDVDRKSIVIGEEEGVEIIGGIYNFHSHPREAYDRHNVKFGWPSAQDYVGFLGSSFKYDTILHIVVSLEGIYIISLTEYWLNNKEKMEKNIVSFILDTYDMDEHKNKTISWYLHTINNISYKNFPLFLLQFFSWYEANTSFVVPFRRNNINCFARQSTLEKYQLIHS